MNASFILSTVEFYEISQLLVILLPIVLFAAYKTMSKIIKHRQAKMMLEKGIIPQPRSGTSKSHWIKSLYIGVFLLLASSPFLVNYVKTAIAQRDALEMPLYLFSIIPFAAGIAYIIRAIFKREDHIRTLALKNGVPFEQVYTSRSWIAALAIGIPLLGYAVVIYLLCFFAGFAALAWTPAYSYEQLPLMTGIPGSMFTLYGLIMAFAARKKTSSKALPEKV
jgi:hypothetical protein